MVPQHALRRSHFRDLMYHLLDFGDGRKLEQFGPLRLDRPCPGTEDLARCEPALWTSADARFTGTSANRGQWKSRVAASGVLPAHSVPFSGELAASVLPKSLKELPERWTVRLGPVALELKRCESGHVGMFPEQAENWEWLSTQVQSVGRPIRVLNMFGYTGGSTVACATAGAEVTHVDAAKNVVAWARRNAELSGLTGAPIHWIAEDAMKFARREVRRGKAYDAVILDPPSYGHGARGEVWRLSQHLPRLLALCGELTQGQCVFGLLTCHTPGYDPSRLEAMVRETFAAASLRFSSVGMTLRTPTGRELPSGVAVRWKLTK